MLGILLLPKGDWLRSNTSTLGHTGFAAVPAQGLSQSPVYRYCSRAPKATGLICRQNRKERSEATTQHELTAPPEPGTLSQGRGTHQGVPENHDALALPLGVQHVGKVGTASTEDAAMGPERLSVYHKDHIAVDALFQKPGKSQEGLHHPGNCWYTKTTQHTHPPEPLRMRSNPNSAASSAPCSPLQEIIIVIPPPAGCSDLFVVSQCTANRVAQRSIETPFSIKGVGLTAGSFEAMLISQSQGRSLASPLPQLQHAGPRSPRGPSLLRWPRQPLGPWEGQGHTYDLCT